MTKPVTLLRQSASDFAFEADGSFLFSRDGGGFGRFDIATGKVTITAAELRGPIAIVGELVLGMNDRTPRLVDRAGKRKTTFPPIAETLGDIERAIASPDARWIAILCKQGLVVLDVAKGTQVGKPIASTGLMFSPNNDLLYVDGNELVCRSLARRAKPTRTPLATGRYSSMTGVLERRGRWLLDPYGRIAHDNAKRMRDLGAEYARWEQAFAWGAEPDQVVRADRTGITIVTTTGEVVRTIARPNRKDVYGGKTVAGWYVCRTGHAIERYDLTSADLPTERVVRKAPQPAKRPPSVPFDDPRAGPLLAAYWKDPEDTEALRVWADLLTEKGDPRGEFILLSLVEHLTPAQGDRYTVLSRKKGEMAGPARDFLRTWRFADGLVASAVCEATQLIAGFDHIRWLNPRLWLTVNALKKPMVAELAKLELGAIYRLGLEGDVIDDAMFAKLAPALAGVHELALESSRLTAAAIPAMAALTGIEVLHLSSTLGTRREVRAQLRTLLPSLADLNNVKLRKPQ